MNYALSSLLLFLSGGAAATVCPALCPAAAGEHKACGVYLDAAPVPGISCPKVAACVDDCRKLLAPARSSAKDCFCSVGYSKYNKSWYYEVYCRGENDGSDIEDNFPSLNAAVDALRLHPYCKEPIVSKFDAIGARMKAVACSWP